MKISRKDKEELYIQKTKELQKIWGNPIDQDWDFELEKVTDEQVDEMLKDVSALLRFEKLTRFGEKSFYCAIRSFVALGIIGLLVFGLRQLF